MQRGRVARGGVLLVLALQACSVGEVREEDYVQALQGLDVTRLESQIATGRAPLAATTPDGRTGLMIMAGAGHADTVRHLLAAGMDPNQRNDRQGTALMFAAVSGDPATVSALLDAGAEVDAVARNGWTALTLAASKGHEPVVTALLAAGADPNLPDMYGWTPLMRAVEQRHPGTVRLLLAAPEIALDAVNDNGATALFRATVTGQAEVIQVLLDAGADPGVEDEAGRTALSVARIIERPDLAELLSRER